VYCPRCGHENEPEDRFCSNCGSTLPREGEAPKEQREERSWHERVRSLIGTTRAAKLTTAGIVASVAIAVIAFLALKTNDIPRDDYTVTADDLCVAAKREIGVAANRALAGGPPSSYAAAIVPIVADWRLNFATLEVPSDRADEAAQLNDALIEVAIQAGALARLPRSSPSNVVAAQAAQTDAASKQVEDAIKDLGLDNCEHLQIAPQSS
jgi:zinc ribbon protein